MAKLVWSEPAKKSFETGVSKGVLFPTNNGVYQEGVAWPGITKFSENPSGGESTKLYADNGVYLNLLSNEEFAFSLSAYMYPDEFGTCDGSSEIVKGVTAGQQTRLPFGFSCQTKVGNEANKESGYKIHLVYGCLASPSEKSYETVNESPTAIEFSWDVTTTPVEVGAFKPTAHLTIDSTKCDPTKLAAFEKTLYGDESTTSKLPLPNEVIQALTPASPGKQ